ncbi:MAG: hypothetical protein J0L99_18045 [Chitinophagales bacterium]|nr:hypothetical protein [Chitinophagales bacterium]
MEETVLNGLIAQYLSGRLSPEAEAEFKQRMATDPQFVQEVATWEALRLQHDQEQLQQWKNRGEELLQEQAPSSSETAPMQVSFLRRYRIALAAASLLLLAGTFWWLQSGQPDAPQASLYEQARQPVEISGLLGGSGAAESQALPQARDAYAAKQYDQALWLLEPLLKSDTNGNSARLLAGACKLEQGKTEEAIALFAQVEANALSLYRQAQYQTAVAHLRARDLTKAKSVLENIRDKDPESKYAPKATALLSVISQQ